MRLAALAVTSLLTLSSLAFAESLEVVPEPIFNGKDLSGWKAGADSPFWKVVDGVLVGQNDEALKGNVLFTEKSYHDFVFECEVRWEGHIDSGVMLRKPELQCQIGISGSLKKDMTCSFYVGKGGYPEAGQAKGKDEVLKLGDWNKIRIEARGNTFKVSLNGKLVTEFTDPTYAEAAPLGLQIHPKLPMKVEYRNIRAKALD